MLWASELSKKTVKGSGFCLVFFFASGTDILPSLIKTLPVTHLIGWLARRLQPCRIKFIYLPQKTHLGRLASERNPARAEAWMTVCGIIFYFSFFLKKCLLRTVTTRHPVPYLPVVVFSAKRRRKSWCKYRVCVCVCVRAWVAAMRRPHPTRCCYWGGRVSLLIRVMQLFPLIDNPTGTLPRGQFAQSCSFQPEACDCKPSYTVIGWRADRTAKVSRNA